MSSPLPRLAVLKRRPMLWMDDTLAGKQPRRPASGYHPARCVSFVPR